MSGVIRCPSCTAVLAERVGPAEAELLALRHKGRQAVVAQAVCIRCECGGVWRPALPAMSHVLADLEYKGGA